MARAPVVEPAQQLLQILPAQQPLVVEHPNDDNNHNNNYEVMDD